MSENLQPQKESVWDYPRPPRLEATSKHLRVVFNGVTIADTTAGYRVLETSHPPVYYIPQAAIQMQYVTPVARTTFCEFKGAASYWTVHVTGRMAEDAAWGYKKPLPGFEAITGYIAFYAGKVDECYVDDERVQAQAGDFYGGWITSHITGPFKGGVGTRGW